jgi:hypothetical protein
VSYKFPWCQWHRVDHLRGFTDTTEISMFSIVSGVRGVIDTAEIICAESRTLQISSAQCQWHCGDHLRDVIDIGEIICAVSLTPLTFMVYWISQKIQSHMPNDFGLLVRGLDGFDWWKKARVKNLMILSL